MKPCYICNNALVDDELSSDNDLAYYGCGNACKGNTIRLASGNRKPVRIEFDEWNKDHWSTVGIYYPKFCPECGRRLDEYKIIDRGSNYEKLAKENIL